MSKARSGVNRPMRTPGGKRNKSYQVKGGRAKGLTGAVGRARLVPRDANVQIGGLQNDPRVQNKEYKGKLLSAD